MAKSLLARLLRGPLRSDHFDEVGSSCESLKVRIFHLREKGITIESVDIPGTGKGRPKVEYHLLGGKCPCCEQDLTPRT